MHFLFNLFKGILQLRPSFPYLDKSDKRSKDLEKTENEEEVGEQEQAKQITVKFARNENDRMRKAREKSFNYLCQKSAGEPWCHTKWHQTNSDVAEVTFFLLKIVKFSNLYIFVEITKTIKN